MNGWREYSKRITEASLKRVNEMYPKATHLAPEDVPPHQCRETVRMMRDARTGSVQRVYVRR